MRNTEALRQVAAAMLAHPAARHHGYDLGRSAGIRSGTLYPILTRMLAEAWVTAGWEESPPQGRPPRRYYRLTPEGRRALRDVLERGADHA